MVIRKCKKIFLTQWFELNFVLNVTLTFELIMLYLYCRKDEFQEPYHLPPIPWSVNSFRQYKSSTFGYVPLKWYILHSFKGQRRLMSWALKNNWLILRPYNSDFLLTTTSFNPSWIMMNEMGVSSHKGRYSKHFPVNISRDN